MDVAGWARHTSRQACIANEKPRQSKFICFAEAQQICNKKRGCLDGAPLFIFFTPAPASHAPIREIRDSLMKAT